MDDAVDRVLAQWARERPDLDTTPMGLIGRVHRLGHLLDEGLRPVFTAAGLSNGDFDVLATLRRQGPPFRATPTVLGAQMMVTSGAVTKRVDRLAAAGLVERATSATDARGREITLTEQGRRLVDDLVAAHVANEERLLAPLEPADRAALAQLLRRWLVGLEGS